jgi:two-component system, cell cycle response regulator
MTLRTKLIANMLFISLITAVSVGGIAYWKLKQNFLSEAQENSFNDFRQDVVAYLSRYGSWENAQHIEPFPVFASHAYFARQYASNIGSMEDIERPSGRQPPPDASPRRVERMPSDRPPPFRFLLIDLDGRVLHGAGHYFDGDQAAESLRRTGRPISVNGRVEVLAIPPAGPPQLNARDEAYLQIMREALVGGMSAACVLAVVLGLLTGNRLSATVRELTTAIRSMGSGDAMRQCVPVRAKDEMGVLAATFNHMNKELAEAHEALKLTSEQLRMQSEQLKELSIRDPLTQLYNRRYFDEQTTMLFRQSLRNDSSFCVIVGDLDHFKAINDSFSHSIGDEVLRRVAKLLQENLRQYDIVARYGGEEFVIAFADCTLRHAAVRCEALRSGIELHAWHEVHPDLRVSMSMGLNDNTASDSVEKMLGGADRCLYEAKNSGRNRVVYAERQPEFA